MFAQPFVALLLRFEDAAAFLWFVDGIWVVHPELVDFEYVLNESLLLLSREHLRVDEAREL